MKKSIIFAVMALVALCAAATDRFYIEDFSIAAGETKQVSILLDNEVAYSAFQCDLYMPDGLTATNFALTERKNSNHTLSVSTLPDGGQRLLSYSLRLKSYSGNSGALVTMDVTANENFNGTAVITLRNIVFTTEDGVEATFADEECTVTNPVQPGDVNGDGFVNVGDVTALISKILGNDVEPFYPANAELTGDENLNVADVTALIKIILNN